MKKTILTLLLLLAACAPSPQLLLATGTAYYVSPTGNDSSSGTSSAPFKTIQKAANIAKAGDTVNIRGGTYAETVTPPKSGMAGSPIIFKRDGSVPVVITGGDYAVINIWGEKSYLVFDGLTIRSHGDYGFIISGSSHNTVQNSDISGACMNVQVLSGLGGTNLSDGNAFYKNKNHDPNLGCDRGEAYYIKTYDAGVTKNTIFDGNEIWGASEGIQATTDGGSPPTGTIITNNIFHDNLCGDQGILTIQGRDMVITGNLAYNNSGPGKCSWGILSAPNIIIRNNVLWNNISGDGTRGGMYLLNVTGLIEQNTFGNLQKMGIFADGGDNLTIRNNIFTQISGLQIQRGGSGNIFTISNNIFGKSEANLGTGAIITSPNFISIDPNSADFLRPAFDSSACGYGAIPCLSQNGTNTPMPVTRTPTKTSTGSVTTTPSLIPSTATRTLTPTRTVTATFTSTATEVPPIIVPTHTPTAEVNLCMKIVWESRLNIRPSASLYNSGTMGYYNPNEIVPIIGILEVTETINGDEWIETWAIVNYGQFFALKIEKPDDTVIYAELKTCP